jgi:hypothetical protein
VRVLETQTTTVMTLVAPIVSLNVQLETVVPIVSLNDGRH